MSQFLKLLMVWSGGLSAVGFVFPSLIVIGIFLIVPGLILVFAPTVFLYTALFSLFWFRGPGARRPVAAVFGGIAVAAIGIIVPTVINLAADGALKVANARDLDPVTLLRPVTSIAIQPAGGYWSEGRCSDLCQLLLFNTAAQRVISLPPPTEPDAQVSATRRAYAFRIVRATSCPAAAEFIRSDDSGNWLGDTQNSPTTTRSISAAVRLRIASGDCLVREPFAGGRVDLLIRRIDDYIGVADQRFGLFPGPVTIKALELVRGEKILARGSENKVAHVDRPLFLEPNFRGAYNISGWQWSRRSSYEDHYDVLGQLKRFTTFRLTTPDGASPTMLRDTLDAALANPALLASHAAFGLLDDYYDLVREKGPVSGDAARLAKIISDERNIKFWFFPAWKLDDAAKLTLRDPILKRLPQLIEINKLDSYKALEQLVGVLPDGALQAADPRIDALIADPVGRRRSPTLVRRLADRGPAVTNQLVQIMREGWTPSQRTAGETAHNDGEDSRAAISGLCRLGPAASSALPALRDMAASGIVPPGMQESDAWRSLLVALGADAGEFDLPKDRQWQTGLYRERLRRDASACDKPR